MTVQPHLLSCWEGVQASIPALPSVLPCCAPVQVCHPKAQDTVRDDISIESEGEKRSMWEKPSALSFLCNYHSLASVNNKIAPTHIITVYKIRIVCGRFVNTASLEPEK